MSVAANEVSMTDLVGLPYLAGGTDPAQGVDCLWAARQAALRIFPDMPEHHFPDERQHAEQARDAEWWKPVPSATRVGDVLLGTDPIPWVAVLVDRVGRYAFTANIRRGTHMVFIGNLPTPALVLRYTGGKP